VSYLRDKRDPLVHRDSQRPRQMVLPLRRPSMVVVTMGLVTDRDWDKAAPFQAHRFPFGYHALQLLVNRALHHPKIMLGMLGFMR
jgi:hypothetical protein